MKIKEEEKLQNQIGQKGKNPNKQSENNNKRNPM